MTSTGASVVATSALLVLFPLPLNSLPSHVPVGALFDSADSQMELAFRSAINRVNDEGRYLKNSPLNGTVYRVLPGDSFKASKLTCEMLAGGVAAIFGPQSDTTSAHVQSICDTMAIPHIELRWDYREKRDQHSINLFPHPSKLGKAYLDIVTELKWTHFAILYEYDEGLIRMQEILKAQSADPSPFSIILQELPENGDYRPLLKDLRKRTVTRVVLDCSVGTVERVLKQAQQVGMMTDYHNYILTTLDLHTLNLEDYQFAGTNVTGIRLIKMNNSLVASVIDAWTSGSYLYSFGPGPGLTKESLTTEAALMYDAVYLYAKALDDLDRGEHVKIRKLDCDKSQSWEFGTTLINYMSMVEIDGLTGIIKFDHQSGFRQDFSLDILELTRKGLQKVGEWDTKKGANYTRLWKDREKEIQETLQDKNLIVVIAMAKPYSMLKEGPEQYYGNDRYEGFCIDIIDEIAQILKFNYTLREVADGKWGRTNEKGEWDGMIKELLDRKADMAIADLTINYEREEAVDFTMPFMNLGISILVHKPTKKAPNLFSFLSPLSVDVWIYMATAYLGVSVLLFVLARFTPYEWDNPHPCVQDPLELENSFSLKNSFWFTIGSLMQQGCDIAPKISPNEWENPHPCVQDPEELENTLTLSNSLWHVWASLMQQGCDIAPKAVSTRMVAGMWWFFTLIMISSYTANLAAFLTVERMESPIESAEDLAKQTKIKYGTMATGSTYSFFRDSNIPTFERMWTFMESQRPTVFCKNNQEGVDRVLKEKGDYAYLMESASIEYYVERNCDLMQVGGLLDNKGYGVALPPDSPYTSSISSAILQLQEDGRFLVLKNRWWKLRRGGGKCKDEAAKSGGSANELGLANVGGVFVVLLGGIGIACLIAVCEFIWKSRKLAIDEKDSLFSEMAKELKFAVQCSGSTKPVKTKKDFPPASSRASMAAETNVDNGSLIQPMLPARPSSSSNRSEPFHYGFQPS